MKYRFVVYVILVAVAAAMSTFLFSEIAVDLARWGSIGMIWFVCILVIVMMEVVSRRK